MGDFKGEGVSLLEKLNLNLIRILGFRGIYSSGTKSKVDVFFITAALMLGTAGLPHVIVRFFTVPKVSDARKSAGYALIFIALAIYHCTSGCCFCQSQYDRYGYGGRPNRSCLMRIRSRLD